MGRRRWVWQAILVFLSLMLRRGRPLTASLEAAPWAQCRDWASRRATHASDGGGPGPRSPRTSSVGLVRNLFVLNQSTAVEVRGLSV